MDGTRQSIQFAAADGYALAGHWHLPAESGVPKAAAVVACGGGIPARFYGRFADHLAQSGIAVLTFDYRGIGASRHGSLRGLEAGLEHWGREDFGAAVALAASSFPGVPLCAIGHSVGNLLIGAAPDAPRFARIVMLAPHTGYWRHYGRKWRGALHLTWHGVMPVVTKMVGFFPGRALRLGEDLPKGVAMQWAGRRQPQLLATPEHRRQFGRILAGYGDVGCPTLVLSITDDAFAPPEAGRHFLDVYPNLKVVHESVAPADLGMRRLGHFAFLRRPAGPWFWDRIAAWLLQAEWVGRASNHGVSSSVVPPSGTKGRMPAGSAALFL